MVYGELVINVIIIGILLLMSIILGILSYEVRTIIETFSHMDANTSTIFGIVLGAIATYILTDRHWKKQIKMQKQNVAMGFYCEIKDIKQMIESLKDAYEKYNSIKDDIVIPGHAGRLEQMIEVAKIDLNKSSSIYDENGLYFHFRKEIYLFDTDIVKSVLKFYRELLNADREFKLYMKFRSDLADMTNPIRPEYDFINYLLKANEEIPKLLEYFSKCVRIS